MRAKAAAFTGVCALVFSACAADEPAATLQDDTPRIVSTSLCGDSYLLDIAPEYASALSWQSRDSLSIANEEQRALPQVSDDLEVLLAANPTHVIFGAGEGEKTAPILEARGIKTFTLDWADSADGAIKNSRNMRKVIPYIKQYDIEEVEVISHTESMIQSWMSYADRGFEQPPLSPKVLYLSRSGGTAGTNTFIDDVIHMSGGENIITQEGWFTPDVETLLSLNPDLIVTSFEGGYESAQAKGLRNSVFRDMIQNTHHVDVPAQYLVCAGPTLINGTMGLYHPEAYGDLGG